MYIRTMHATFRIHEFNSLMDLRMIQRMILYVTRKKKKMKSACFQIKFGKFSNTREF